jgi:tetratricopeptide (TPR) repeat protein
VAALYRRAGDPVGEAKYLSNRATDLYYDGEWARALELYRTAASMSATHGHTVSEATCLNNIAEILSDQGRLAEAATLFRDAGRSWRSVGYGIGLALLAANRGRLATRSGDHAEAQRLLEEARRAFADLGATVYACETILRAIDDDLVAGVDVAHDRWPTDTQLDAEITLRLYADRLRASTLADDDAARELLASTAERAADAGLPFEEALAWHVAASRFDDEAARHRATEIFARLDVRTPPPVPHHHPSSITA